MKWKRILIVALLVVALSLMVFPAAIYSDDCETTRYTNTLGFNPTGWAGWSCPEGTTAVEAGVLVGTANTYLWEPGATAGGFTYPNTPFGYTYGDGETGMIIQNDGDGNETITYYVDCQSCLESDPDPKGIIGVEKVDGAGNILTGAGFTLYNSDKSVVVVAEKMVDAAGKVAFKNLPLGTYVVSETTVPGGYSGMADKTVVINADNAGTVINVTAKNTSKGGGGEEVEVQALTEEPVVEVLAFTGQNNIFYIIGFVLVLLAGGLGITLRAGKKRQ